MKTINKQFFSPVLFAAASLSGLIAQANAAQLEEIIVTAQGREQSLDDVPVSVSVVSGEMLNDFSINSLQDVADRMPNVNIATGPFDLLNIRGVGSGNNGGFQQSVGTFVDGIYRSRSRSIHTALFDVDRVEILKGPQTTFFGANSIAGALNITTRSPGDVFGYNVSGLYGTDGEFNLEGGVDLPVSETLSVRFAARKKGMDGYLDTRDGKAPDSDAEQVRLSVNWNPADYYESDFRIDHGDSTSRGALAFQLVNCPAPDGSVGTACALFLANNGGVIDDNLDYDSDTASDFVDVEFLESVWTNTFDVGDQGQLIFKTGWYEHDSKSLFTGIPFPSYNMGNAPLPPFLGQLQGTDDAFPLDLNEEFDQLSQEVRYQTDSGGKFDYMVGAYYAKSHFHYLNTPYFFFNDFGAIVNTIPLPFAHTIMPGEFFAARLGNDARDTTESAFFALTFRPMDRMTINVGGRYTRFEKWATRSSTRGRTDAEGSFYDLLTGLDDIALNAVLGGNSTDFLPNKRIDEDFMPSLSVQYDLADNMMGYVSYTEGFKAGGFSASNNPDIFEPEYVDAYEAGIKGDFFEGRLKANLTYFFNDYTDLQESAVVTQGVSLVSVVRNAASSESEGLEFDGAFLVNDNLTLTASLALLRSEYESFPNGACSMKLQIQAGGSRAPCLQDLSGKSRAYSPEYSGNIGAQYSIDAGDYKVRIDPSVYFTHDMYLSAEADEWLYQDKYAKLDLRVAIMPQSENWSLALIGKNLTDETTASYASPTTNSDGSARYIVDRPRSFAIQFNMRY